jgi:aspartyl-tRNA(Asn)/glutamyl-tRNA(Gln) amidotransferase subunit C
VTPPAADPEEVRRIAALARIRLRPEEVASLAVDFARILDLVGRLRERSEADGEEPMVHSVAPADPVSALRDDEPRAAEKPDAPLPLDAVLGAAPERARGHLVVPRVLAEGR